MLSLMNLVVTRVTQVIKLKKSLTSCSAKNPLNAGVCLNIYMCVCVCVLLIDLFSSPNTIHVIKSGRRRRAGNVIIRSGT
jgi:hypothetical protein